MIHPVANTLVQGTQGRLPAADPASPLGLYIHVPFCERKCPYCDFNTYAGLQARFGQTVDALCQELAQWADPLAGREITSIFIGGGTPTVLAAADLTRLMACVRRHYTLSRDCEITCEANPGTVDRPKFQLLRDLGVNRLSLGVQSFQPDELSFLGRIHGVEDVYQAFEAARASGFTNINLDFIFGLPHQPPAAWADTLAQALTLGPEHLSLYSLIVEPNTPLHHWVDMGRVDAPDDDEAAALYELAMNRLAAAGYVQYEISNWARATARPEGTQAANAVENPAFACRHNLLYWRNQEYVGVGPGAHSHLRLVGADGNVVSWRWSNRKPVPGYNRRVLQGEPVVDYSETLPPRVSMGETMMLGLRLIREGVPFDRFQAHHRADLRTIFAQELSRLAAWGLLEQDAERIRLSRRGVMVGNQVFAAFLAD